MDHPEQFLAEGTFARGIEVDGDNPAGVGGDDGLVEFGTADGQSIDVVDQARMAELGKALRDDTMGAYLDKYPQG